MTSPNADTDALEVALDAVLVRYGIPLGFGFGNGADRGDLASDLADAARAYWTGILDDADTYPWAT